MRIIIPIEVLSSILGGNSAGIGLEEVLNLILQAIKKRVPVYVADWKTGKMYIII